MPLDTAIGRILDVKGISAMHLAAATGIPGFLWVIVWIGISLALIALGVRMYAAVKAVSPSDSVFEDIT